MATPEEEAQTQTEIPPEAQTGGTAAIGRAHTADARLIIAARGLRSFGYGLIAVLLGVALSRARLSPATIGVLITVSLAGDFCSTYAIGLFVQAGEGR